MKLLVRLGPDVTVKSDRIRAKFVTRLLNNIKEGFARAGVEATVKREWSRLYVDSPDPRAADVLRRTFGVSSFSVVEHECAADMDTIVSLGHEAYRDKVADRIFAVRARRVGNHPFTSVDINQRLGAALRPYAKGVNLSRPDVSVHVEVRGNVAHLFSQVIRGPGGLPLGVSGKVLCLLSGGFDSAVAAWLMQKRGVETEYVFCNLAGGAYERSVATLAKLLHAEWGHGTRGKLHVLDFQPVADEIRKNVKGSHAQVILKRMFYRAASRLAEELECTALLTGECVGQVSSQTLKNLATIESVTTLPILRPVVGFDKEEIVEWSRRIGTYALSAGVQEYCQLVPDKPVTACRPDAAAREESRMDMSVVDRALASRRTLFVGELSAAELVGPYLHVDALPADAVVIDCRPAEEYAAWHHPAAVNHELHDLLAGFGAFDKRRTYVLYCPVGLQSAVAAEAMQKKGFQAYSFKGGVRALRDALH